MKHMFRHFLKKEIAYSLSKNVNFQIDPIWLQYTVVHLFVLYPMLYTKNKWYVYLIVPKVEHISDMNLHMET